MHLATVILVLPALCLELEILPLIVYLLYTATAGYQSFERVYYLSLIYSVFLPTALWCFIFGWGLAIMGGCCLVMPSDPDKFASQRPIPIGNSPWPVATRNVRSMLHNLGRVVLNRWLLLLLPHSPQCAVAFILTTSDMGSLVLHFRSGDFDGRALLLP